MDGINVSAIVNSTFHTFPHNASYAIPGVYDIDTVDAAWTLSATLIFFTMQTGLALLEAGIVSKKNEVNVMMKKIVDISFIGIAYWLFGFALMYGRGSNTTPFFGLGDFIVNVGAGDKLSGQVFTFFFFQISFASTATTLASGGAAERFKFSAYTIYCFFSCLIYSVGAGWIWGSHGWLKNLGALDFAGSMPIHLVGGVGAFVLAWFVGPRLGRYEKGTKSLPPGNPFNVCLGLFIVMWGWYGFNAGSGYGLTTGKWQLSARAAVNTVLSSMAAGIFSVYYSMFTNKGKANVMEVVSGILCALAAINSGCFVFSTHISVLVGVTAACLCLITGPIIDKMRVDDAVGVTAIHFVGGAWGAIATGLFADPLEGHKGLFYGGGVYLLLIQTLSVLSLTLWAAVMNLIIMWTINKLINVRLDPTHEMLGCDITEHFDEEDEAASSQLEASAAKIENIITAIPQQRFVCPCQMPHNGDSHHDNLNQRRCFYINKSFEH